MCPHRLLHAIEEATNRGTTEYYGRIVRAALPHILIDLS